jgi:hypothetical protein
MICEEIFYGRSSRHKKGGIVRVMSPFVSGSNPSDHTIFFQINRAHTAFTALFTKVHRTKIIGLSIGQELVSKTPENVNKRLAHNPAYN